MNYKSAVQLLEDGKGIEVRDYFKKNNHLLEYGYTYLLYGDLVNAYNILSTIASPRAEWASKLAYFLYGNYDVIPSYFQIRNFLEIDISLFFKYEQLDFIQTILNNAHLFQENNSETYKFLARVLFKHGYREAAKVYMDKSVSEFYKDIEVHYLYAEFYLSFKDKQNALKALHTCLRINPKYFPAVKTYRELTSA